LVGLQKAQQGIQVGGEQIFASDVQDDALADLLALAIVLDQAEVFVAAVGGFAGSVSLHFFKNGKPPSHFQRVVGRDPQKSANMR